MNKMEVIDSLLKSLLQQKKDFISNESKLERGDSLKDFAAGQISGITAAMDILLDTRIQAELESQRVFTL